MKKDIKRKCCQSTIILSALLAWNLGTNPVQAEVVDTNTDSSQSVSTEADQSKRADQSRNANQSKEDSKLGSSDQDKKDASLTQNAANNPQALASEPANTENYGQDRVLAGLGQAKITTGQGDKLIQEVLQAPTYGDKKNIKVTDINTHNQFLNAIAPHATQVAKSNNLYPSVMMAQAALETGYGTSFLAQPPNHNLFGIKGSYRGQSVMKETSEYTKDKKWVRIQDRFAKYPSYTESFKANARRLRKGVSWDPYYYKGTWRENTKSYQDATKWLTGRYATDPNYNKKLDGIIEKFELTRFDQYAYEDNPKLKLTLEPTFRPGRIQGGNRYANAANMSRAMYQQADTVVLANGNKYTDALTGSPLASLLDAPLLLTPSHRLSDDTLKEIQRLGVSQVYILGGYQSVSQAVEDSLKNLKLNVERIGGANRYDQAALVAEKILELQGKEKTDFFIASGENFPDALSIASTAASKGIPILLTAGDRLSPAIDRLKDRVNSFILIGGNSTLKETVQDQLDAQAFKTSRLAGNNRYEVNRKVLNHYDKDSTHYYLVSGEHFSDALPASVLAAKNKSALVFIKNDNDKNLKEQLRFVRQKKVSKVTLIGGTSTLSPRTQCIISYADKVFPSI